ncbi:hypothetical protein, partial [Cronobacter sakazakii]|uniref:hypothetical protein n=1 Tax=Cronobacter sakazakii TaxID=28141 RepID=UPI001F3780DA
DNRILSTFAPVFLYKADIYSALHATPDAAAPDSYSALLTHEFVTPLTFVYSAKTNDYISHSY